MPKKLPFMNTPRGIWVRPRWGPLMALHFSPAWLILEKLPWLAARLFQLNVDERAFEYPLVHTLIGADRRLRVLDVGCWGSRLPLELATLGHESFGIDVQEYPFVHPNLSFVRGDACRLPFADGSFDVVTAISSVEHFGLGRYGDPVFEERGDVLAVREMGRVLAPGGRALIAVPFGSEARIFWHGKMPSYWQYDPADLQKVFVVSGTVSVQHWIKVDEAWRQVEQDEALSVRSSPLNVQAVAFVILTKGDRRVD